MSIKYRLILSYIGMIVIPVVVIVLITNFIFSKSVGDEGHPIFDTVNPLRITEILDRESAAVARKINLAELSNRDRLGDKEFIKKIFISPTTLRILCF